MTERQRMYIEMPTYEAWSAEHERFKQVLDDESYWYEVPTSIRGQPRHPQFTITIHGHKITIWCQ